MKQFEETVRLLTELLLPMMRHRIDELGVEESGAYNFYRSRLEENHVMCGYEIELTRRIVDRLGPLDEIHEIGCGWGQLVFLLAWCGYAATGFEGDQRRFRGAEFFLDFLCKVEKDRLGRARLRNEFFPPLDRPEGRRSLVVATNVIVSNPHLFEEHVIWALRRYRYAVVDVDRFCTPRKAEERAGLVAAIERVGFVSGGLFCDAGQDGCFYLFERDG